MKELIRITVLLIISLNFYAQNKVVNSPKFFSQVISETEFQDCLIISKYYSLKDNITNKKSSAYLSNKPTLNQIERTITSLSSDYFILTKNHKIIAEITIIEKLNTQFQIVLVNTNSKLYELCNLKGDITENRAKEIITNNYDPSAYIKDEHLNFNNKKFKIVSNQELQKAVEELIKNRELHKKTPSKKIYLSKNQLKEIILKRTKAGGKMDFFTAIKGHEDEHVTVGPEIHATKSGMALYKWGEACFNLGVYSLQDAYDIFEAFKKRELHRKERDYIKFGYNKTFK